MSAPTILRPTGKVPLSVTPGSGKTSAYLVRVGTLVSERPDLHRTFRDCPGRRRAIVRAKLHRDRLVAQGLPARIVPVSA